MADDVVIRAEGLGKKYVIGHAAERERYVALRDVMARGARAAWRKTADVLRGRALIGGDTTEEFWALKDVNFEVKRGEVLGIIGRNGAGKSTLLKVLSRITEPSEGRATIRGRVASLLEVGTGFHPELSGRENIYLNGAILGMSRAEIRRKFDEMVSFAGTERFLDTPVKRYSSGMYVRLAFAVAAHLDPEILIIDEVLAVGDAEFQKKCLGKVHEISKGGRTVLFVSHNMGAIQSLTTQCVWLQGGKLMHVGKTSDSIGAYLGASHYGYTHDVEWSPRISPQHGQDIRICKIVPQPRNGTIFYFGEDLLFDVAIRSNIHASGLRFGATISDSRNVPVFNTFSSPTLDVTPATNEMFRFRIVPHGLVSGTYFLSISVGRGNHQSGRFEYDIVRTGATFSVASVSADGASLYGWLEDYGSIVNTSSFVEPVK